MRTRLLVSAAALSAALVLPGAALAVGQPNVTVPAAVPSPFVTSSAPIHLEWDDVPDAVGFRIFRAAANCVTGLTDLTLLPGPLDPGSTEFDDIPPVDGNYCYYVEALDLDNVTIADSAHVLVDYDRADPSGSLAAPIDGAVLTGAVNALEADNVSDDVSGVDTVVFERFNGIIWVPVATSASASSPYTANWNTGSLTGTFLFHASITDNAGNTFDTASANVTVDNSNPAGAVTLPTASALLHGSVNALSTTASDSGTGVSSVTFERSNGVGWTTIATSGDTSSPYTANWDTGVLSGSFDVHAVITDGAGHTFTTPDVTVDVDNTVPTGSLTAPTGGAVLHGTTNALAATASNTGPGTPTVRFEYFDGSQWQLIDTDSSAPFTANWNTGVLNGTFDLQVVVTDSATNQATSSSVSVVVDNAQPAVLIGGIANDQNVSGSRVLSATASDTGGSGVASVQYGRRAAGSNGSYTDIGSAATVGPYNVTFDTLSPLVPDGLYQIRALATDLATNQQESSVTNVRVDNTDPSTPGTPTGLTPVSASPTISFTHSTDAGAGIDHYDVYRDGSLVGPPVSANGPYLWSDTGVTQAGPHVYTVVAVDAASNESTSLGGTIYLDPTGLSAPTSVAALATPTSQRPQFSWGAPPVFQLDHYTVYRNSVAVLDTTATTFTDNTAGDGSYTYQVVAKDLGNVAGIASAPVTILFDTTVPTAPGGVAAAAALDGSVGISWANASDGAGSGVARYVVRRSLSSSAPVSAADGDATCQGLFTSCADATTLNGKLYSYSVFAVDAVGNTSAAGSSPGVTARDQLAPAAPKGLAATAGDGVVDLRWSAAGADDDVAGYVLVAKQGAAAPASEGDGTRVCTAIVAASTTCSATGLTNGATYTFGLFALDEALNRSQAAVVSAAPNGKVTDAKAPAAVTKLTAKVTGRTVKLTWKNPADRDFDHVVITASERKPSARAATKRVYAGKGTKTTTKLAAGEARWFTVVAYDAVGNASPAVTLRVNVPAPSLFRPAPRAKVHGSVRLSWPVKKGAKYYNVQVYAGKKRILVSWPAGGALQLPRAKLKRGTTYTWYVWPGLGAKAKANYGKLIGKNSFTFAG